MLAAWQADFALSLTGETDAGAVHAQRAIDIGRELGDASIELIGCSQLGLALVARGDVAEGMRLLQASAAAAVAGEIADRALAGYACCYLITACGRVHDDSWTRSARGSATTPCGSSAGPSTPACSSSRATGTGRRRRCSGPHTT